MNTRELSIAGAMIYACEGAKIRKDKRYSNTYYYAVEVTNSSPEVIILFMKFLRLVVAADLNKVKGQLFSYTDQDVRELEKFWSEKSGISLCNFQKTIVLPAKTGKFKPNPLGTFKIRYNSKADFLRIQQLIDDTWRDRIVV